MPTKRESPITSVAESSRHLRPGLNERVTCLARLCHASGAGSLLASALVKRRAPATSFVPHWPVSSGCLVSLRRRAVS